MSTESWLEGAGETPTRNGVVQVMELEGHAVGMAHELILRSLGDDVLPGAIGRSKRAGESLSGALQVIFGRPVDIVVFGYTHEAMVETHGGILLVNPGSPSLVGQQVRLGTVAILELDSRDSRGADHRPGRPVNRGRGHRFTVLPPGTVRGRGFIPGSRQSLESEPWIPIRVGLPDAAKRTATD